MTLVQLRIDFLLFQSSIPSTDSRDSRSTEQPRRSSSSSLSPTKSRSGSADPNLNVTIKSTSLPGFAVPLATEPKTSSFSTRCFSQNDDSFDRSSSTPGGRGQTVLSLLELTFQ